jgi:Rho GTPase-activating protein 39
MFESTLQQIMENQKSAFPDLNVPIILPHLTQLIVNLGGFRTEGIFRIPGDVDLVHLMKLQVESGNFDQFETKDPRAPSSLLSLWLRELKEPVIPDSKYEECLQAASDPVQCVEVIHLLPSPNKDVLIFLIKFLQSLIAEENQQYTKMGAANVAMVFAPNFLRCRSPNPAVILANSKAEHQFVVNLLGNFK